MEIPILSSFIEGLRLFLSNKRLKWLTGVFLLSLVVTSLSGGVGLYLVGRDPTLRGAAMFLVALTSGVWPVFFMLASFMALVRLERFVASDESYKRSAILFIPWIVISFFALFFLVTFFAAFLFVMVFIIAFLGWIVFQAYFSTRTALRYGGAVHVESTSRLTKALSVFSNAFNYIVIIGALAYVLLTNIAELLGFLPRLGLLLLGTGFALLFNMLNSMIMVRERNSPKLANVALIGMFISLYSAYFIYNAGKPVDTSPDIVSIAISIFFVFYTMSSVGRMLKPQVASESFFRISADFAAMLTFFLASGYYFADVWFPISLPDPTFGATLSDLIKLIIFPFIALIMELLYLRQAKRVPPEVVAVPEAGAEEEMPPAEEEEPTPEAEMPLESPEETGEDETGSSAVGPAPSPEEEPEQSFGVEEGEGEEEIDSGEVISSDYDGEESG